jgi:hypothetical protein
LKISLINSFFIDLFRKKCYCPYLETIFFVFLGLAYNGVDANGEVLWNGGANVKLRIYEKASRFQHVRYLNPDPRMYI